MYMNEHGYTLLEVLVATALLALMALPLSESLRVGLFAWSDTHTRATEAERFLNTHDRLRTWLMSAYPAYYDRLGERTYPMKGDATSLSFIAPVHPDARSDNMYQVSLSVTDDGILQANLRPDFEADGNWCLDEGTGCLAGTVMSGVESIEFAYWDAVSGSWVYEWPAPTKTGDALQVDLPEAVKIALSIEDSDLAWPDLVIRLKVDEWARCEFQSETLECS